MLILITKEILIIGSDSDTVSESETAPAYMFGFRSLDLLCNFRIIYFFLMIHVQKKGIIRLVLLKTSLA